MINVNFDYKNSNIEIEEIEENKGITFEELCEYIDNLENDNTEIEETLSSKVEKEKVKSDVIVTRKYNRVSKEVREKEMEVSYKVKKMSTSSLIKIFKQNRSYPVPDTRQGLINVVCIILSDPEYFEQVEKEEFDVVLMDKSETTKLGWEEVKEIRRLYNIKQQGSKDSCYSFKEIGDLYNLSHIFTRNICLGKVYKSKS